MAKRKKFIAGNWKMFKSLEEAKALARAIAQGLEPGGVPEVAIFPAFPFLVPVIHEVASRSADIGVGAQNLHPEPEGAFTGEVSGKMIRSVGARYVIAGHSERRHVFGESDELVGKKVRAALDLGLTPILCVGEKLDEREKGETLAVVNRQLRTGLERLDAGRLLRVVIAYEPVWAIGTGKTATPQQGEEVHRAIRGELAAISTPSVAEGVRILYGGSVKPANIGELLAEPDIDGALIGGASLEAPSFLEMCRAGKMRSALAS